MDAVPVAEKKKGSLVVVGTGIRVVGQLTVETIAEIKVADVLLYLGSDPLTEEVIQALKPGNTQSLYGFYGNNKPRIDTYKEMVDLAVKSVHDGFRTCMAFYGHPGIFVYPGHEAIRRVKKDGYEARMLPAISAEDCLFADLGIDPGTYGCQSYEATDFTINNRVIDPTSIVVLWQAGLLGDPAYNFAGFSQAAIPVLVDRLCQFYSPDYPCHIYAATTHLRGGFQDTIVPIRDLPTAGLLPNATLCLEPAKPTQTDTALLKRIQDLLAAHPGPGLP